MSLLSDKLKELQELKDPSIKMNRMLTDRAVAEAVLKLGSLQGVAGKDGYTPFKGIDYFTSAEINSIADYIQSRVKNGEQGVQGIQGVSGRDGQAPIRGVDYWTDKDQQKILREVLAKIPKPKDGSTPKLDEIVNKAVDVLKKQPINFKDIKGTEKLVEFLKLGGFRGGGNMQGIYTDKITLSATAPTNPKYGDLWYDVS